MHELAIAQSMFDIVLDEARKADARKVSKVNLVIGEMSDAVGECIRFYFDFLSQGTIADGAALDYRVIPVRMRCSGCEKEFPSEGLGWTCPHCDGHNVEIISGRELFLESIEVE